jgi:tetratricopeptide (TPR) repeat protein
LNQCAAVVTYLRLVVWPHPLCVDYGQPEPIAAAAVAPHAALLAGALGSSLALLAWRPRLGFLAVWFFLVLAPTSSIVPITSEVAAERRVYLALAGPVVLVVVVGWLAASRLAARLCPGRPGPLRAGIGLALLGAALLPLSAATVRRNREYDTAIAIWDSAVRARPDNTRAPNNRGAALELAGRSDEALRHYRTAVALKPSYASAHYNLANGLGAAGRLEEAIGHYRLALALAPGDAAAHNNLAVALERAGRLEEAIAHWRRAAALDPGLAQARENLARALDVRARANAAGHPPD